MDEDGKSTIRFHGKPSLPGESHPEFAATISFQCWDPTTLEIELLWLGADDDRRRGSNAFSHLGTNHVWLESLDAHHGPVEILGISQISTAHFGSTVQHTEISAAAILVGMSKDKEAAQREFGVVVRLQPSGILVKPSVWTTKYTGEIEIARIESGNVGLVSGGATLDASCTYAYQTGEEYGSRVTKQAQQASLMGSVRVENGRSLLEAHEELRAFMTEVCVALSLCYRQPITFYEIEYFSREIPDLWRRVYRRRTESTIAKRKGDELINIRALFNGGLQRLVDSIQKCPRATDLGRAIGFLAASYTARVETAYFMAFSALETVVSCCLESHQEVVAGSAEWKRIQGELRNAVMAIECLDSRSREAICQKLSELRRVPFVTRVRAACERFTPKTVDLWPMMSLEVGVMRAAKIRNGLFHASNASPKDPIEQDLIRIRMLTERLLLKLLSWPDDQIWVWHDQDLKWMNQR